MKNNLVNVLIASLTALSVTACGNAGNSVTVPNFTEDEEGSIYTSGKEEINTLAEQTIVYEEGEEIEAQEWVDTTCFRVQIVCEDSSENEAVHQRDYFFFCEDDPASLMVDYSINSDSGGERQVHTGCDFEARREDVNFDGHSDLLIALGDDCWCVYLYEDGDYRYEPTFEEIKNYCLIPSSQVLYSTYQEDRISMGEFYSYNDSVGEFVKIGSCTLKEGEKVEAQEWVDSTCFRARIAYSDMPGSVAVHQRDYFFFCEADPVTLMVDYEIKTDSGEERPVYTDCDFEARREDVNFDGNSDLLIALGRSGFHGDACWCAYLYEDGDYRYEPSFEKIVNYVSNPSSRVLYSNYLDEGIGIEDFYSYNDSTGEFEKTGSCTVSEEFFFKTIAKLIMYENENDTLTQGAMNEAIVSNYGEIVVGDSRTLADGSKVQPHRKMSVEDMETFYREVMGIDITFPAGYEDSSSEIGIVVPRNGYAYAYNGIGGGIHPVVTSIVESAGVTEVSLDVVNDFDGSLMGDISFSLTTSDNPYEYTLNADSVQYNEH